MSLEVGCVEASGWHQLLAGIHSALSSLEAHSEGPRLQFWNSGWTKRVDFDLVIVSVCS